MQIRDAARIVADDGPRAADINLLRRADAAGQRLFRQLERAADWEPALLFPVYVLAGSALLGYLACGALLALAGWLGKREERQLVLLIAIVGAVIALAVSEGARKAVLDALFGAEEEFEYTSTTSINGS